MWPSLPPRPHQPRPGRVPVVEGGGGEDDGELVGPSGGVAPAPLLGVPEVALRGEAHDALGEAAPHQEGKVHLAQDGHGVTHRSVTHRSVTLCSVTHCTVTGRGDLREGIAAAPGGCGTWGQPCGDH